MADFEWVFLDGSIVRAHQHSTGVATESSKQIGKSRGGNSMKLIPSFVIKDMAANLSVFLLRNKAEKQ